MIVDVCWDGFEASIGHAGHTLRQRRPGSQQLQLSDSRVP